MLIESFFPPLKLVEFTGFYHSLSFSTSHFHCRFYVWWWLVSTLCRSLYCTFSTELFLSLRKMSLAMSFYSGYFLSSQCRFPLIVANGVHCCRLSLVVVSAVGVFPIFVVFMLSLVKVVLSLRLRTMLFFWYCRFSTGWATTTVCWARKKWNKRLWDLLHSVSFSYTSWTKLILILFSFWGAKFYFSRAGKAIILRPCQESEDWRTVVLY